MGGRVVRSLKAAGARTIALVVQPYPYAEAIGGLPAVLEAFPHAGGSWDAGYPPPRRENRNGVWQLVPPDPINAWQEIVNDLLARQSVPAQAVRAGQTLDLGDGVRVTVLAPGMPFVQALPAAPNNSIVLRLTYGNTAFLFAGGLERAGESALLARAAASKNTNLAADWLRVARCGTREATSPEFARRVSPVFAVVSTGGQSAAGYPHRETLTTLANSGALVRRTDDPAHKNADLVFESDGARVTEAGTPP
jgi:beta-lactamase superfamily II metal-dependent hydrolase